MDIAKTYITVASVKTWLVSRGVKTGFFFPVGADAADYLDPKHPRYAPKLAAAVKAWQAMEDAQTMGKTP